jgi:hypothetical protein
VLVVASFSSTQPQVTSAEGCAWCRRKDALSWRAAPSRELHQRGGPLIPQEGRGNSALLAMAISSARPFWEGRGNIALLACPALPHITLHHSTAHYSAIHFNVWITKVLIRLTGLWCLIAEHIQRMQQAMTHSRR